MASKTGEILGGEIKAKIGKPAPRPILFGFSTTESRSGKLEHTIQPKAIRVFPSHHNGARHRKVRVQEENAYSIPEKKEEAADTEATRQENSRSTNHHGLGVPTALYG